MRLQDTAARIRRSTAGATFVRDPEAALLIAAEQVRAQYANMPTAFISNAVISLGLCFALRETVRY